MSIIHIPASTIKYNEFKNFNIYKTKDIFSDKNNKELIIPSYGNVKNILSHSAIKYLTSKYDFIRSTFVDFRGNWATQVLTDIKWTNNSTLTMGRVTYDLNNYNGPYPLEFITAIESFMNEFNKCDARYEPAMSPIILISMRVEFKTVTFNRKTYYYINNMFMTANDTVFKRNHAINTDKNTCVDIDLYTILCQIPGVLRENNIISNDITMLLEYNCNSIEKYINDANEATGYSLI